MHSYHPACVEKKKKKTRESIEMVIHGYCRLYACPVEMVMHDIWVWHSFNGQESYVI